MIRWDEVEHAVLRRLERKGESSGSRQPARGAHSQRKHSGRFGVSNLARPLSAEISFGGPHVRCTLLWQYVTYTSQYTATTAKAALTKGHVRAPADDTPASHTLGY